MPAKCVVPGCTTGSSPDGEKLALFKVPSNRVAEWRRRIPGSGIPSTNRWHVCELHFEPKLVERVCTILADDQEPQSHTRLVDDALPTIFPSSPEHRARRRPPSRDVNNVSSGRRQRYKLSKENSKAVTVAPPQRIVPPEKCGLKQVVTVRCYEHKRLMIEGLWNAFKAQNAVDLSLMEWGGKSLVAHQLVADIFLSSKKLLGGALTALPIEPEDLLSNVKHLLEFMYKGRVTVGLDKLDDLLEVARLLDFEAMVNALLSVIHKKSGSKRGDELDPTESGVKRPSAEEALGDLNLANRQSGRPGSDANSPPLERDACKNVSDGSKNDHNYKIKKRGFPKGGARIEKSSPAAAKASKAKRGKVWIDLPDTDSDDIEMESGSPPNTAPFVRKQPRVVLQPVVLGSRTEGTPQIVNPAPAVASKEKLGVVAQRIRPAILGNRTKKTPPIADPAPTLVPNEEPQVAGVIQSPLKDSFAIRAKVGATTKLNSGVVEAIAEALESKIPTADVSAKKVFRCGHCDFSSSILQEAMQHMQSMHIKSANPARKNDTHAAKIGDSTELVAPSSRVSANNEESDSCLPIVAATSSESGPPAAGLAPSLESETSEVSSEVFGPSVEPEQGAEPLPETADLLTDVTIDAAGNVEHSTISDKPRPCQRLYKCKYCKFTDTLRSKVRMHELTHDKSLPFVCSLCHRSFMNPYSVHLHMLNTHGIKLSRRQSSEEDKVPRRAAKRKNRKKIEPDQALVDPMVCPDCQSRFCDAASCADHRQRVCRPDAVKPFVCTLCDRAFVYIRYLIRHLKLSHDIDASDPEGASSNAGSHRFDSVGGYGSRQTFVAPPPLTDPQLLSEDAPVQLLEGGFPGEGSFQLMEVDPEVSHCGGEVAVPLDDDGERVFICTLCELSYVGMQNLRTHLLDVHDISVTMLEEVEMEEVSADAAAAEQQHQQQVEYADASMAAEGTEDLQTYLAVDPDSAVVMHVEILTDEMGVGLVHVLDD